MTDGVVLAVDIGGTKLAAASIGSAGALLKTAQRPTPVTDNAEDIWNALMAVVGEVDEGALAVGVGCGGPMLAERVSPLNIPAWRDFPLADRLRESTGLPVSLHNDAIAMATGEYAYGAGRDARAFLGIVVSTGVGGGLVLDGRAIDGPTGNAGHIGHVVVDADGPVCVCGGRGCLEAIARGPAVVAWACDQGWTSPEPDGRSLVAAARAGDAIALASLTRAGRARHRVRVGGGAVRPRPRRDWWWLVGGRRSLARACGGGVRAARRPGLPSPLSAGPGRVGR